MNGKEIDKILLVLAYGLGQGVGKLILGNTEQAARDILAVLMFVFAYVSWQFIKSWRLKRVEQ